MSETPAEPLLLPVLPLKDMVVFPEAVTPLAIGQERSVKLIDDVVAGERTLALVAVQNEEADPPGFDDLYEVGTAAVVHKMIKVPDGTLRVLVQGTERIRLREQVQGDPYLIARFEPHPDVLEETPETEALTREVQAQFGRIIGLAAYLPEELQVAAANVDNPSALCHLVASTLRLKTAERQMLLEMVDVADRLRAVLVILNRELEVSELGSRIQSQVASEIDKGQREYFLRQQLKAIREELGETSDEAAEVEELRRQVEEKELPEEVGKAVDRELARLERLPSAAAEYGVIRTYIDWILSLPWTEATEDDLDLRRARRILDEDHFDLDKVKERIVEYLAVSKLKQDLAGPILCFVGPPGVGKTSLGQSIARALGRKFQRLSVGGVRDEAEIRGHRRTYIGAMPGTIIRALRDAGSRNPVVLIDEIDKMGADFRGDPASAMLEVLDPEQNRTFRDHYLDLPFDLSKVLFICTANQLDTIPGPLLDRMDVIELSGYTEDEKVGIARKYLVPKQLAAHGLDRGQAIFPERTIRLVISEYTREAGLRNLERQLAALCRKVATQIAKGKAKRLRVDERRVREWLGPRRFAADVRRRTAVPGVATGLAYTARRRGRALHRGHGLSRRRPADDHGAARRGDAGVGASGTVVGALARGGGRRRPFVVLRPRRARPRARGRGAEGRAVGGDHDRDGDRVAHPGPAGLGGRGHDRGDHAHRPCAPDRRRAREGARGPASRSAPGDPASGQRARPRGAPARDARRADLRARRRHRRGARRGVRRGRPREAPASSRAHATGGLEPVSPPSSVGSGCLWRTRRGTTPTPPATKGRSKDGQDDRQPARTCRRDAALGRPRAP